MPPLQTQYLTIANPSIKIRVSILATAMVDALGGPPEFRARFTFPLVTSMIPNDNFSLPPGVWTDDTSMTLCLARSLATYVPESVNGLPSKFKGGFDEKHQLDTYMSWYKEGILSPVDRCFDIGNTIRRALSIYDRYTSADAEHTAVEPLRLIRLQLSGNVFGGNGSLMRILPIGLAYWRDETLARSYARRSSETTHPNALCLEACEMWTGMITQIVRHANPNEGDGGFTKLDLVKYITTFPYTNIKLQQTLSLSPDVPPCPTSIVEHEQYYQRHHPLLQLIQKTQSTPIAVGSEFPKTIPKESQLPSSGYVLHTLIAALYCFLATNTFEEGAIMVVNLGNDADTVGAVYAGLAGCWYGEEDGNASGAFWTKRVGEWKKDLVKRELVEEVAEELVGYSETLGKAD